MTLNCITSCTLVFLLLNCLVSRTFATNTRCVVWKKNCDVTGDKARQSVGRDNDSQLTSTGSIAYFQPPSSRSNFTPAVGSHERPCIETFRRCIADASRQQRRPCTLRWRQKHFDFTAARCCQRHYGLNVFQVDDARVRLAPTTIAVQRDFQLAVDGNSPDHTQLQLQW